MSEISIAKLFFGARKKMGLTQRKLADRLDIDPSSVRNYELGRRIPESDIVWNLSNLAPPEFIEPLRSAVPESFRRAIEDFKKDTDSFGFLQFLDGGKRRAIEELARNEKKELAEIYADLVMLGLQARLEAKASALKSGSHPSPKDVGAKTLNDLKKKREAHVRVQSRQHGKFA